MSPLPQPQCGFLNNDGSPCALPATRTALVSELGVSVPCCDHCGIGRQVTEPQPEPEA